MAHVTFTAHLQRHLPSGPREAPGATLAEVLDNAFAGDARLRAYVLDEQGAIRRHVAVFIDGVPVRDRGGLTDAVAAGAEIYVMQALSGG